METMRAKWRKFREYLMETSGVSTVEYALIVVAVIAIVGVGVATLGDAFNDLFTDLSSEMGKAASVAMDKASN